MLRRRGGGGRERGEPTATLDVSTVASGLTMSMKDNPLLRVMASAQLVGSTSTCGAGVGMTGMVSDMDRRGCRGRQRGGFNSPMVFSMRSRTIVLWSELSMAPRNAIPRAPPDKSTKALSGAPPKTWCMNSKRTKGPPILESGSCGIIFRLLPPSCSSALRVQRAARLQGLPSSLVLLGCPSSRRNHLGAACAGMGGRIDSCRLLSAAPPHLVGCWVLGEPSTRPRLTTS